MSTPAERKLARDTFAALGIRESPQTAALSVTHAPLGKGGKNWITASKPGNTGQLPAYIQNIRNAIMRGPNGKDESSATAIAIARVKAWASGGGNVSAEVRAAAAKALAEFEKMRAGSHKVKESAMSKPTGALAMTISEADVGDLALLEAAVGEMMCPKHKGMVKPKADGTCPTCGADMPKPKD